MSQKSSVPQAVSFVSQVLKRDTFEHPGKSSGRPFLGQRGASYGPVDALPSRRDTAGGHNTQKD